MPVRTQSHKTGDQAASEIALLCSACGWACDTFKSDYGEDLLVQPDLDGQVDHCRIWIQSKVTRNIGRFLRKSGDYSFSVSFDHALRWARSADLVVFVLWDVERSVGYWTLPLRCVDEWDWYLLGKTRVPMVFPHENVLNQATMRRLGWMARVHHYDLLLGSALRSDSHAETMEAGETSIDYKSRSPLIVYDFLSQSGILKSDGIDSDVQRGYRNAVKKLSSEDLEDGASVEHMAAILAILAKFENVASMGLPTDLLSRSADLLVRIISEDE